MMMDLNYKLLENYDKFKLVATGIKDNKTES